MCDLYVGGNPPPTPQQQAVVRFVKRVVQRGVELGPRRPLEHGLQKIVDRRVVAARRSKHRQPHAAMGRSLRGNIRG